MMTEPPRPPSIAPDKVTYIENLARRGWDTNEPFWALHRLEAFRARHMREHPLDPGCLFPGYTGVNEMQLARKGPA
jgi:2-polyprenyl-3-methyl-5-hydroxy-6-metoxy-1,4-benzoquinol methylase